MIDCHSLQWAWPWRERALYEVLFREAAALVLDPAFPTDPFAP
jgi:hypothetical protein